MASVGLLARLCGAGGPLTLLRGACDLRRRPRSAGAGSRRWRSALRRSCGRCGAGAGCAGLWPVRPRSGLLVTLCGAGGPLTLLRGACDLRRRPRSAGAGSRRWRSALRRSCGRCGAGAGCAGLWPVRPRSGLLVTLCGAGGPLTLLRGACDLRRRPRSAGAGSRRWRSALRRTCGRCGAGAGCAGLWPVRPRSGLLVTLCGAVRASDAAAGRLRSAAASLIRWRWFPALAVCAAAILWALRCFSSRSVAGLLGPGAEGCD